MTSRDHPNHPRMLKAHTLLGDSTLAAFSLSQAHHRVRLGRATSLQTTLFGQLRSNIWEATFPAATILGLALLQ